MASPQKENGYTAISNDILDALGRTRIPGEARQCLDIIIRQTYGFQKKEDDIALSQFVSKTRLKKQNVCRSLLKLITMNIIIVIKKDNDGKSITKYRFNKDYDSWVPVSKKITNVIKSDYEGVSKKRHTKETITKERKKYTEQSSGEIEELIKRFEAINPACKSFYGRPPQRKACLDLINTYGFDRVKKVIELTLPKTNNIPYFPTITTPQQLRDKWATLESQIIKAKNKKEVEKPKSSVAF